MTSAPGGLAQSRDELIKVIKKYNGLEVWSKVLGLAHEFKPFDQTTNFSLRDKVRNDLIVKKLSHLEPWMWVYDDTACDIELTIKKEVCDFLGGGLECICDRYFALVVFLDEKLDMIVRPKLNSLQTWRGAVAFRAKLLELKLCLLPDILCQVQTCLRKVKSQGDPRIEGKSWWEMVISKPFSSTSSDPDPLKGLKCFCFTPMHVKVISEKELIPEPGRTGDWMPIIRLFSLPEVPFEPEFVLDKNGQMRFVIRLNDVAKEVQEIVDLYGKSEETLFVFPELSMTRDCIEKLAEATRDTHGFHIIAGSEHVIVDDKYANRSCYLSSYADSGKIFHLKHKAVVYRVSEIGEKHEAFLSLAAQQSEIAECLENVGGELRYPLTCIDTIWGRLSFIICRDALGDDVDLLKSLTRAGVDHLFVLALSPKLKPFVALAETRARQNAATYILNMHQDPPADLDIVVGFPFKLEHLSCVDVWSFRQGERTPFPGLSYSCDPVGTCTINLVELIRACRKARL